MLQKLNERIQGVIAWSVIILIAFTFTLFGVDNYLQSRNTSDAKIVVNDTPISNQEFENNYRRSRQQLNEAPKNAAEEKRLQAQVLDEMIKNLVTMQSARNYGFEVTPAQAQTAIVKIPQFQEDGHFSTEKFQQALSNALYTVETFQTQVRQGMLLNQQRFAFIGSSFALPDEITRFVKLYMQTRDYDFIRIKPSVFLQQAKTTPEAIQAYYNSHKKEFMTPEQISLDYIKLSMQDLKNKIKVSSEDIKRFYEENTNNYLTPAQWKVAHILYSVPEFASKTEIKKIQEKAEEAYTKLEKNPQLFNELVTTASDDKLSLADKGELPWITAGQKEYDKLLAGLSKPGQISKPERTKHGFEIFKLIDYKPVTTKTLAEVTNSIKNQILSESVQNMYTKSLEQLSDLTYQTPESLEPAAKALGLAIQKTEVFSRNGGKTDFTKNKLILNAAFNHDLINLGNNSDPVQLSNDSVVVLRVNKHLPATQQVFETVKSQIENTLLQKRSEALAKQLGTNLLNAKNKEEQLKLMQHNKLQWQSVTQASRDGDQDNIQLNELAFNLLKPNSQDGITLANGDYVVVKLKQVNDGQITNLDKEQRDSLEQQIEASFGMMDYDLYVANLLKEAQIVKN